ncbi:MAG: proteasome ATPase [Nitrospirae bacterium]|nr:proteasome ATPase [Candidatus Troglogloeales bacterium]MBI3598153.1 proteasome ATPase [Candidatus Troglogloeales bacterium]
MKKLSEHFGGGDKEAKIAEYEREIEKLLIQSCAMEEELKELRQSRSVLSQALKQNEKLTGALGEAKNHIEVLKKEVEKLTAPPASYAVYAGSEGDGTVSVIVSGRKMKVNLHPDISTKDLKRGQQVILNEALNAIEVRPFDTQGEVVFLKDLLGEGRAIVTLRTDEDRVVTLSEPMMMEHLSVGDNLLYDEASGFILEKLPKSDVGEVVIEEIPDVTYEHIGGLAVQLEQIRDAVELPFLYPELYAEHKLSAPKGVLLYGPPGCGKTLIAKAVASSIGAKLKGRAGHEVRNFFLHVKGPELLNKYVGESERQIREIFKKAQEHAEEGNPVIIFFDEMDALFRTRGTGISSDTESTIVPQFLSEIDGLERLKNVIVIGASNRQDLLDPAIMRPGRLDVKIKIERPDEEGARDIFRKYLTADLPFHPDALSEGNDDPQKDVTASAVVSQMIDLAVAEMYGKGEENKFLEVTYANGEREIFYFKDFSSGAMIEGIVARTKKYAVKRAIDTKIKGIKKEDIIRAIRDEYKENEDLPNTTNPDDWAKISGRKGEKIVHIRTIAGEGGGGTKSIETITTGHYL